MQRCTITLYVDAADRGTGDRRAVIELSVAADRLVVGARIKRSDQFAWRKGRYRRSRLRRIAARLLRILNAASKSEHCLSRSAAA